MKILQKSIHFRYKLFYHVLANSVKIIVLLSLSLQIYKYSGKLILNLKWLLVREKKIPRNETEGSMTRAIILPFHIEWKQNFDLFKTMLILLIQG